MARTVRDAKLRTRETRGKLEVSGKPYYRAIDTGLDLGYRKGKRGGKWVARWYKGDGRYKVETIAASDDVLDADGDVILNFSQAQAKARDLFQKVQRVAMGLEASPRTSYTVRDVIDDYVTDYRTRSDRATDTMLLSINSNILPDLGAIEVGKLSRRKIRDWHHALARRPARLRTGRGGKQNYRSPPKTPEAIRRRRSTANKMLAILKAALNRAYKEGDLATDADWASVKPFRDVDAAKIRYLTEAEAKRLVNACVPDLKAIVTGALLTGSRYGELANLMANDFDAEARTLHIAKSKSGKARNIALTDEGVDFFSQLIAGSVGDDVIFSRASGSKWGHAQQTRPIKEACHAAKITPEIGFHILRHTYASRLAMKGVPMFVIAQQLGHADTRMTEKHYAHLSPSYVADTIRAALGDMGLVEASNIVEISSKQQSTGG
jgi:integrase